MIHKAANITISFALAAVLLLLLSLTMFPGQVAARPILAPQAAGNLLIPNGPVEQTILAGSQAIYLQTLTNPDTVMDTYTVTVSANIFTTTVNPPLVTLGSNESAQLTITVDIPSAADGSTSDSADLRVVSGNDPSISDTLRVTTTVVLKPNVDVTADTANQTANPNDAIVYNYTVTNKGNAQDTIVLTATSHAGWTLQLAESSLLLARGASQSVALTLTVPSDALGNMMDTTVITGTSSQDISVSATVENVTTVNVIPGVNISGAGNNSAAPGETVTYTHEVQNPGNFTDTYTVDTESSEGFDVSYPALITVGPGGITNLALTVTVADNALSDIVDTTAVTVTSGISPAVRSTASNLTTVTHKPGVTISDETQTKTAQPGNTAVFSHTVTNTGNKPDSFTIALAGSTFPVVNTPPTLSLNPQVSAPIFVTVTVPSVAEGTSSAVTITVRSSIDANVLATAVDTTIAGSAPSFVVSPDMTLSGLPGEMVTFTHEVTNTGNGPDSFAITTDNPDAIVTPLTTSSLAKNQKASFTVIVPVPVDALSGESTLTIVTVTSQKNTTLQKTIDDTVIAEYAASVIVDPLEPINQQGYTGQWITYQHEITNDGNKSDTFILSTTDTATSFQSNVVPASVTLDKNKSEIVTVKVLIPATAAVGINNTTILTARSVSRPDHYDTGENVTSVAGSRVYLPLVIKSPKWEQVGSINETIRALAVCPTDPSIAFAGTSQKVYQLSNGDWQLSGGTIIAEGTVTAIVLNDDCTKVYASVYNQGVWQSSSANWGVWTPLAQGLNDSRVRTMAYAGNTLYAGGEIGIRYWDDTTWKSDPDFPTNVDKPIMFLAADPDSNAAYGVQWLNSQLLHNPDASNPTGWTVDDKPGLDDNNLMRSVSSNGTEVGTMTGHFRLVNGTWETVRLIHTRAFAVQGADSFAGYTGNTGVYRSPGGSAYVSANNGFSPIPDTIYYLIPTNNGLYAATSSGAFVYR